VYSLLLFFSRLGSLIVSTFGGRGKPWIMEEPVRRRMERSGRPAWRKAEILRALRRWPRPRVSFVQIRSFSDIGCMLMEVIVVSCRDR
jgi:hypothetical protein